MPKKKTRPIKVFYSPLSGRFFATKDYAEEMGGIVCVGEKYDVTDDIAAAVLVHGVEFKKEEKHV